jgi:hypothetical protein
MTRLVHGRRQRAADVIEQSVKKRLFFLFGEQYVRGFTGTQPPAAYVQPSRIVNADKQQTEEPQAAADKMENCQQLDRPKIDLALIACERRLAGWGRGYSGYSTE